MTLDRPYMLVLLIAALLPLVARRPRRWVFPAMALLNGRLLGRGLAGRAQLALRMLAIAVTAVALAGPRFETRPARVRRPARNIFILVDVSRSMAREDFPAPDGRLARVEAAKRVVAQFLGADQEDRVGVIAFGTSAFTVCPLTLDHEAATGLLSNVRCGVVGDKTAIGDALMLALARLRNVGFKSSLILLVTDGRNTAGQVAPAQAALLAREHRVPIYAIGIGADASPDPALQRGAAAKDTEPGVDVQMLEHVTRTTGGRAFLATRLSTLQAVFDAVRTVRPAQADVERAGGRDATALWALIAAVLVLVDLVLATTVGRTVPAGL